MRKFLALFLICTTTFAFAQKDMRIEYDEMHNPNPGGIVTQPNIGYLYGTSGIDISNSIIVNAYQQNGISFGVPYTGWLNRNRSEINLILGYLYSNNFSIESLNNLKDFIDLVKNNPTGYTMSQIINLVTASFDGVENSLVENSLQQGSYLVYSTTVSQMPLPSFSSFYASWPKQIYEEKQFMRQEHIFVLN